MDRDSIKQVIAEWVLTNGRLPMFDNRVKDTLKYWSIVGSSGMIVYRAQGGFVRSPRNAPPPTELVAGIRPVLATSKSPTSIARYAGDSCCIFKIHLPPGTRYLDVNDFVTFINNEGERALAIKNTVLEKIHTLCPLGRTSWPHASTSLSEMRQAILDRCFGRVKHDIYGKNIETILPENEIMVYAQEGTFSEPKPIVDIEGKKAFEVNYIPWKGGRGRTFRRKPMRRSKNGDRLTRKSKHSVGRNRDT